MTSTGLSITPTKNKLPLKKQSVKISKEVNVIFALSLTSGVIT